VLLEVAGMARSTFYYHNKASKKSDKYAGKKESIVKIYHEHKGRYGYRRITGEMKKQGLTINHKTVLRLMGECGIKCQVRLRKYRSYKGDAPHTADNLLKRDFSATAPNRKWVTDVTEFSLFGKKLYLSPIMDLYNREIVSYAISERPTSDMTMQMLDDAFSRLPDDTGLILHSDQGWHYKMQRYRSRLCGKGIRQSMSRKGNCLDNAAMESFFAVLKSELLYLQTFRSMEHFRSELEDYIDYYNNKRIKNVLNNMSPVQYRTHLIT
jgi:transposase InsO family protein